MNSPLRLLIVEDSPTDAKLVLHALRAVNPSIESERVEDAQTMREALTRRPWDLIISDWSMPRFSAPAALEVLRDSGLDVPFIVVSGTIGEEAAVDIMRAGARDYVFKDRLERLAPAVERELREHVERALRRSAEEMARAQETRFRALIENSTDAITLTGRDGTLLYVSPAMARMLGAQVSDLVGRSGIELVHPDDQERIGQVMARIRSPGAETMTVEFRALGRDGATVWLETTARNMLDDPAVGAIVGNLRNVTEERRNRQDLRLSEARYRCLADSGVVGIVLADVVGNIHDANDTFLRLAARTREELIAGEVRWSDMTPPDMAHFADRAIAELMETQVATPWETDLLRRDGTRAALLVTVAMLEPPQCIAIVVDISERKKGEAALEHLSEQLRQAQKMEAIGSLAGGVAHDFNNVLSVILSYSDMILDELTGDDPLRDDIIEIRTAGMRAAALTRQLLMFSRQQVIEPKVLDLNDVLIEMDKMLRRLLGEDIDFVSVPGVALWNVRADPGSIEQVIMNLAVNSRDAMPLGGQLTMETSNVELDEAFVGSHHAVEPGAYVMLAVTDTGTGMDKRTQARIFEPFFTTKETGKGTGLGLSTVFGIVQQMCGYVWVYSELGKGTTFKVYLPRVQDAIEAPRASMAGATLRGSETILLVEDEDQVRLVARGILRKHGYHVIEARNAGEALLLCEKESGMIHLLLTDVVMPQMSGPELAKRLVGLRPDMNVLYMSGYTDDTAFRHGIIESGVAFLQKPITVESLTRKVRDVLRAT